MKKKDDVKKNANNYSDFYKRIKEIQEIEKICTKQEEIYKKIISNTNQKRL